VQIDLEIRRNPWPKVYPLAAYYCGLRSDISEENWRTLSTLTGDSSVPIAYPLSSREEARAKFMTEVAQFGNRSDRDTVARRRSGEKDSRVTEKEPH
jgi:hypothetical protein